jgi:hypothetical protein
MRRLPGPAVDRLGEEGDFRGPFRVVSGLAENTNSIFCDGSSEPEAANGCPVLRGRRDHQPRGSIARSEILTRPLARSPQRAKESRAFYLTMTYMDGGHMTRSEADGALAKRD